MNDKKSIVMPVEEVTPIGFHAKFIKAIGKPYKISVGKSKLLRRAIILIFVALAVMTASLKFIPESAYEPGGWPDILLWLPRIVSLGLALLAILRIREIKNIMEFMSFDKNGVKYQNHTIKWDDLLSAQVEYSITSDEQFDLILNTTNNSVRIDIKSVDEFSEDVAVVLNKYWKQFGSEKLEETELELEETNEKEM